jgi:hypothetical protein
VEGADPTDTHDADVKSPGGHGKRVQ